MLYGSQFTLEYWLDEGWYVGKLKEVPGVFSQGETLAELESNIRDAFRLMLEEGVFTPPNPIQSKEVGVSFETELLSTGASRSGLLSEALG